MKVKVLSQDLINLQGIRDYHYISNLLNFMTMLLKQSTVNDFGPYYLHVIVSSVAYEEFKN